MPPPCAHHAFWSLGVPLVARAIGVRNNFFKRVLDIIRTKIRHFKGENKWKGSEGRLDSNGLNTEGLMAAQRNELIVPGQNIAFSLRRRLIRIPATDT